MTGFTIDPQDLPSLAQLLAALTAAGWAVGLLWGLLSLAWSYWGDDPEPRKKSPPGYF